MFKSLKFKLVVAISLLVVILLSITSSILINDKVKEVTRDIYKNAKTFSKLSTKDVVQNYNDLLKEGGFYLFSAKIKGLFDDNEDISRIRLMTFEGSILYDSRTEKSEIYVGEPRAITDANLIERIQAKNLSVATLANRTFFVKVSDFTEYTVDANEVRVPDLADGEKVHTIVVPFGGEFAVMYDVTYQSLDSRIAHTKQRIYLLTAFGILLGIAVGYIFAGTITNPISKLKTAVGIIAKGNFKNRVTVQSQDEVGSLAVSVNTMAADLEKSTKALVYKERVAKELELAGSLQRNILPKSTPIIQGMDVASSLMPAAEVGGDLYDFIQPSDHELISYVGDVTGHGVPAGILGSVANALIYGYADKYDIRELLAETNKILAAKTSQNMFLTMVLTKWCAKEKTFSYVSAGHEQILYYSKKDNSVRLLEKGGLAMGMVPDILKMLKIEQIKPEPGDIAVVYTDGVPEAWKSKTEMYGMERFQNMLKKFSDLESAEAVKYALLTDLKQFMGDHEQMDDITVIVYKW